MGQAKELADSWGYEMDEKTKGFLQGCFAEAAKQIRSRTGDRVEVAKAKASLAEVKRSAGAYLERIEQGQAATALKLKGERYKG